MKDEKRRQLVEEIADELERRQLLRQPPIQYVPYQVPYFVNPYYPPYWTTSPTITWSVGTGTDSLGTVGTADMITSGVPA